MTEPRVLCICPYHLKTHIERARSCFAHQTYLKAHWREWDTSFAKMPIGEIRNHMVREAGPEFDVIAHFDHDDWSAPTRLAEQLAFMHATGLPVVGYSDMPFYDEVQDKVTLYTSRDAAYVLGTSLLYRRDLWESMPFPEQNDEDTAWLRKVGARRIGRQSSLVDDGPRMIATIHRRNTSSKTGSRFKPADATLDRAVRACLFPANVAQ